MEQSPGKNTLLQDTSEKDVPLCVDLDGTLSETDLSWVATLQLIKRSPAFIPKILLWMTRGLAYAKRQIALNSDLSMEEIPWTTQFIEYLKNEKKNGRQLVLCTAADIKLAQTAAKHWGIFDEVLASDGVTNLRGSNKAKLLVERFGEHGFDYAGNSLVDMPVWQKSRKAIVVNSTPLLAKLTSRKVPVAAFFPRRSTLCSVLPKLLKPEVIVPSFLYFIPWLAFGHDQAFGPLILGYLVILATVVSIGIMQSLIPWTTKASSLNALPNSTILLLSTSSSLAILALGLALLFLPALTTIVLAMLVIGLAETLYLKDRYPANLFASATWLCLILLAGQKIRGLPLLTNQLVFWFFTLVTIQASSLIPKPVEDQSTPPSPNIKILPPNIVSLAASLIASAMLISHTNSALPIFQCAAFGYWAFRLVQKQSETTSNPWELIIRDPELLTIQSIIFVLWLVK